MRQKLGVTLAVAVLALSGARETCKQFNGLRSLAGEWSGLWTTMLVYANVYAEGADGGRPAQSLIASTGDSRRDKSAPAAARGRRVRLRVVRQTPRERQGDPAESRVDLEAAAFGLAAESEALTEAATRAATVKVSRPRPRVAANAAEIADALAGAFHTDFDADSLRALAKSVELEMPRAPMSDELSRRERAGVERKLARAEHIGERSRSRSRFVYKMIEPARVGAEATRGGEAAIETWPAPAAGGGGPDGLDENEVFFTAPQSSSGLFNCEAQPRR